MNSLGLLSTRNGDALLQELTKNFLKKICDIPNQASLYSKELEAADRLMFLFLVEVLGTLKPIPKNEVTPDYKCATCN